MNVRSVKYVSISFWHTNDRAIGTGEATREQVLLLWVSMLFMSSFLMGNLPISCRECCRKELNLAFYSFENCKIFFTTKHGGGIFFSISFFSRTWAIHRAAGERGSYLFNSSLPLPPAAQILRHYPGDYCRELGSGMIRKFVNLIWMCSLFFILINLPFSKLGRRP